MKAMVATEVAMAVVATITTTEAVTETTIAVMTDATIQVESPSTFKSKTRLCPTPQTPEKAVTVATPRVREPATTRPTSAETTSLRPSLST